MSETTSIEVVREVFPDLNPELIDVACRTGVVDAEWEQTSVWESRFILRAVDMNGLTRFMAAQKKAKGLEERA